ncbi:MAG: Chromosome partitioning protein ParB [Candidatus Azambacteria bacterium GW2011_GWE1_42_9]|nr:MAG: Chromosome partitioning protein ParB [Candidatus Azambacteria bacterium GW2011_GWF1_41_10]KKS49371.1 MAG: Chromosome partitioning protein ParB [Candidatus Azambacteria bacterium GW2011_GWF2_42_22]KKS79597.1 MAG: Chromosome partitioning protein ParB [Candidatus Azambacteria bacterium GW2011_GWE1_42_9]KKT03482.1 MAG: Chromosome partitioning protein ParB [Candidatus Azambacteria bacterium GW2011_GWD1_43_18]KKT12510.1 MAG: Chromosome partitioning protein ParB [Candidatus Azambacteria bacter
MKFQALGKGLESLIPRSSSANRQQDATKQNDGDQPRHKESIFLLEIDRIKQNPLQPRRDFDEDELKSLAGSIREHGILQPIIVTKLEQEGPSGIKVSYELIAGERRLRAAKMSGLDFVPAIIRKKTDSQEKLELALVENVQRSDLNPLERARSFERLHKEFGLAHYEIADKVGKSREFVTNTIRLLQLPVEIQKAVVEGKISEGHGRTVLSVEDINQRMALYKDILEKNLTVRAAESIGRQMKGVSKKVGKKVLDPEFKLIESRLEDYLSTRVKLAKEDNRGSILIEFYSPEELNAIIDKIISS